MGELTRLARLHSTPGEEKGEVLKRLRTDYESMQRQLNIALRKIEMMAAEVCVCSHNTKDALYACNQLLSSTFVVEGMPIQGYRGPIWSRDKA